jgi:hypothetical protein
MDSVTVEKKFSPLCKLLGHRWETVMISEDQTVYSQCRRCGGRRIVGELDGMITEFLRSQESKMLPDATYVDVALCFPNPRPDIMDFVEMWHDSTSESPVDGCLGMTMEDYSKWVESPAALPEILYKYAKGRYSQEEPLTRKEILISFGKFIAGYRPGEELWSQKDQQAYTAALAE